MGWASTRAHGGRRRRSHGAPKRSRRPPGAPVPSTCQQSPRSESRTSRSRRPRCRAAASSCGHRCRPKAGGCRPSANASRKMSTLRTEGAVEVAGTPHRLPAGGTVWAQLGSCRRPAQPQHARRGGARPTAVWLSTCRAHPRHEEHAGTYTHTPVEGEGVDVHPHLGAALLPHRPCERDAGPQQAAPHGEELAAAVAVIRVHGHGGLGGSGGGALPAGARARFGLAAGSSAMQAGYVQATFSASGQPPGRPAATRTWHSEAPRRAAPPPGSAAAAPHLRHRCRCRCCWLLPPPPPALLPPQAPPPILQVPPQRRRDDDAARREARRRGCAPRCCSGRPGSHA